MEAAAMKVDFYRHALSAEDGAEVAKVLASPFLTTGKVSAAVEAQLGAYFATRHAVLVNSWTNGSLAVLMAMDVGPGDEVIVPAMTFIAAANIVELLGATTVLVDIDPATLLVSPEAVARAVTARTKAVIPVHLYGLMVDIRALRAAIEEAAQPGQRIYILEDCAHCFEGKRDGERPGRHSDAAAFSFYATKNVTCGEGGAVILNDDGLHARLRETRTHGMSAMAINRFAGGRYNHWDMTRLGTKANLPDLLAALLPRQIASIDTQLLARKRVADRYRTALTGNVFRLQAPVPGAVHAEHLFAIGIPGGRRDAAIEVLNAAGIGVTVNYRALPAMTYYRQAYPDGAVACPIAMQWGEETVSLPLYPELLESEQDYVVETLLDKVVPLLKV
jgi:UDP-4-amino-4-deoxy-L-arabinose-oxoglutarate aminotransferase